MKNLLRKLISKLLQINNKFRVHLIQGNRFKFSKSNLNLSFKELDKRKWNLLWTKIKKSNLLQSWEYGDSKKFAESLNVKRYVLEDREGKSKALVQVLKKNINFLGFPLGSIVRINRGPLLLDCEINHNDYIDKYCTVLLKIFTEARRKKWWLILISPEVEYSYFNKQKLKSSGLFFRSKFGWGSSLVSLNKKNDEILAGFKPHWRRCFRKSLKNDIKLERYVNDNLSAELIIDYYYTLQKEKGFEGISENLIREMLKQKGETWRFNTYLAKIVKSKDEFLSILVTVIHGDTAIYLLGYTNPKGRSLNASYFLFWNAILDCKEFGCKWFDLGGLNNKTSPGIKAFKNGFNGDKYDLVGEAFVIPSLSFIFN